MGSVDKPLAWLHGEIKTPPFSKKARIQAGFFLRRLQRGESIGLPHSRPMPSVGAHCHELRIADAAASWRIIYRVDPDAIVIAEIFAKKTQKTPKRVLKLSEERLKSYDDA
jgi:phage-related protein